MLVTAGKWEFLTQAAKKAALNAYCPYSQFPVGAAILTETGDVYVGCNVENIAFGSTICAERTALCAAVAYGHRKFRAVVIYTPTSKPAMSCGACRQMLAEFGDVPIRSVCQGEPVTRLLSELLPDSFTFAKP